MATFRSRQRASQRRDGKREPRFAEPREGQKPEESRPAAAPTERPAAPKAGRAPGDAAARAPRKQPQQARREEDGPRPLSFKNKVQPESAPRQEQPAPAEPTKASSSGSRRRLISPVGEAPASRPAAEAKSRPQTEAPARPAAEPVRAPAPASTPRRRLITPVAEATGKPSANAEITPRPAAAQTPRIEDAAPAPRVEDAETRQRREDTIARRQRYQPDQRRGLPTNERMPIERPVFERRSAETRRRGDVPLGLAMFASCPRGLEPVLQQELQRMQASDIEAVDGGVGFRGSQELLMRVNLESRVASRVLLRLAQGPYRSERDVNALAMQVNWPHYFTVEQTIKVKTDGVGALVKSLDYVSLTVKDAVCDRFRQAQLGRPSVDTRTPDVRIQVFLSHDSASIYLDSSGDALFKRGWRRETGEAPLRENLAAGILLLAGYDGTQPLLDPMCGSGTFLVEAADIALNRAPGRARAFAFEKWQTFDPSAWQNLKLAARQAEKTALTAPINGSDNDAAMVAITRANLARAGVEQMVDASVQDIFASRPSGATGLIVTNPPYGVRLDEQETLSALYPLFGDWLKQHFTGWTANFFTGDLRLEKLIRLKMKRRIPLYNGALECRLFVLPIIAGSARKP